MSDNDEIDREILDRERAAELRARAQQVIDALDDERRDEAYEADRWIDRALADVERESGGR
jgi:hypothetical protein